MDHKERYCYHHPEQLTQALPGQPRVARAGLFLCQKPGPELAAPLPWTRSPGCPGEGSWRPRAHGYKKDVWYLYGPDRGYDPSVVA